MYHKPFMAFEASYLGVKPGKFQKFVLKFARFEYALKAAGFWKTRQDEKSKKKDAEKAKYPGVVPDWDRFASSIAIPFKSSRTCALKKAYEYLLGYPPDREIVTPGPSGDEFGWETQQAPCEGSEAERVLKVVQWVRNHLIHGAGFNSIHGNADRNSNLIPACLTVLEECLALCPKVKAEYDSVAGIAENQLEFYLPTNQEPKKHESQQAGKK